jgi:hypothetical protein
MAILENEVLVKYNSKTYKHYESLGYIFPKYKDKSGVLRIKRGSTILVKVEHLTEGSNVEVTKICDMCGKHVENQKYCEILICRKNNEDGIDKCLHCQTVEKCILRSIADEENCIATTNPEFAKLFWNEEDGLIYTCNSGKKADFKCPECGSKIEQKIIANVNRQGLSCPYCSDDIPYPEKFIISLLDQLNIKFKYQKSFDAWYDNKIKRYYDFYIPHLDCIIETHGMQHYDESFERYGDKARTVKEEQENDAYKKNIALRNGINNSLYIVIDARYSKLDFIKNSIINSNLSNLFNLSNINWLRCHEDACKSIVEKVCLLWMESRNLSEISKSLQLDRATIRKYLKQGSKIGWVNYDAENRKKKSIPIVQLSLNGEFINEFSSSFEASKLLGLKSNNISSACKRKNGKSYGYMWMYKDQYTSKEELNIAK